MVVVSKSDVIDRYLLIVDVEIYWNERDLLVGPIQKEDFGIGGRAQYEVSTLFYACNTSCQRATSSESLSFSRSSNSNGIGALCGASYGKINSSCTTTSFEKEKGKKKKFRRRDCLAVKYVVCVYHKVNFPSTEVDFTTTKVGLFHHKGRSFYHEGQFFSQPTKILVSFCKQKSFINSTIGRVC